MRWVPWLGLVALAAGLSLQKIRSFDYWWQLRTGALIAETGAVPRVDPYSFTAAGSRWIDVHWLHQLGLHAVYGLAGHAGVVATKLVLVLGLLAILAPVGARRERPLLSVAALGLMLLVAADRIMPRPELPTFLCLAAVLALLDRFTRRPDARVYAVVAVQLLWVNIHGLFALGIAICLIYLADELLRPLVLPGARPRPARLRRLAAVTGLSAAVSPLNPNGLDGVLYPLRQLGMIGAPEQRGFFGTLIAELTPPIGAEGQEGLALWLFAAMAALSFAAMTVNWRRIRAADALLWVAFLYLALSARRNVALFAIAAAPILVRNLNAWLDALPLAPGPRRFESAAAAGLGLLLAIVGADAARGGFYPRIGSTREPGFGVMELFTPVAAVDWIERERPEGPICHHMADGGYLIWRLYPDYRVMTDGRLEVYGEEAFAALDVAPSSQFRRVVADHDCRVALLHYSLVDLGDLLWWLHLNSNWKLVLVDEVAALYARVGEGSGHWSEIDVDDPALFPPLPDERSQIDRRRRLARTNFLMSVHRYEAALALWKETLERYPDLPKADVVHAALLYKNGFAAASEAILRRLLEEDPRDPELAVKIGDLRFEGGDPESARAFYQRALELEPRFAYAHFRLGEIAETGGDPQRALEAYLRATTWARPGDPIGGAALRKLDQLGR